MSEVKKQNALKAYNTICEFLEENSWEFERNDENLYVKLTITGEDLPIKIIMIVSEAAQYLNLVSPLVYDIPEDKRMDIAAAICAANYNISIGNFEMDFTDGQINFEITSSLLYGSLNTHYLNILIVLLTETLNKYNIEFYMISKGMLSVEDFIKEQTQGTNN